MSIPKIHPRFQVGYLLLSVALAIGAAYSGFSSWGSIAASLVLWLLASASYPGLEFSKDGRYIRNYYSFLNHKISRWESLPPIIGITVKQFSQIFQNGSKYNAGIWGSSAQRYAELVVMLSAANFTSGIIVARFPTNKLKEALVLAQNLAEQFDVPVNMYLPAN